MAVTEKTEACEKLLTEITTRTQDVEDKKKLALAKAKEIAEQNEVIKVEKVGEEGRPAQYSCLLKRCT